VVAPDVNHERNPSCSRGRPVDKAAVAIWSRKMLPKVRDDTQYRELSARLAAIKDSA